MKNQRSLGLVVEGNSTSSSVLRLPSLAEDLGPIKAGALRVSRRLSNYLRAGYAVNTYEDLQGTRMILLRVPDGAVERIVGELCQSELPLKDVGFVLCESCMSATVLEPLRLKGAWTASLYPIQSLRHSWFITEGHISAVRQLKRLLQRNNARAFDLRPGGKALYFAAQVLATTIPAQLYVTAQHALRDAGISGNHLHDLLEDMSLEMFRSFANGVRLAMPNVRMGCSTEVWNGYLEILRIQYPQVASVIDTQLEHTNHRPDA
jgi:predicted short-subunit dehydrogenase-like oxidoreductase (DUF2520 family)